MSLTPKQERFCREIVEGKSQADAYRAAYDAENMKPESVWTEASLLMSDPKVSKRVAELKQEAARLTALTVEDLIKELEEARAAALGATNPQSAAAVAATMGKAKLLGLAIDKVDSTVTTRELPASIDDFV